MLKWIIVGFAIMLVALTPRYEYKAEPSNQLVAKRSGFKLFLNKLTAKIEET